MQTRQHHLALDAALHFPFWRQCGFFFSHHPLLFVHLSILGYVMSFRKKEASNALAFDQKRHLPNWKDGSFYNKCIKHGVQYHNAFM